MLQTYLKNKPNHYHGVFFQTKILFLSQNTHLEFFISIWLKEINQQARHSHYYFKSHEDWQFSDNIWEV